MGRTSTSPSGMLTCQQSLRETTPPTLHPPPPHPAIHPTHKGKLHRKLSLSLPLFFLDAPRRLSLSNTHSQAAISMLMDVNANVNKRQRKERKRKQAPTLTKKAWECRGTSICGVPVAGLFRTEPAIELKTEATSP